MSSYLELCATTVMAAQGKLYSNAASGMLRGSSGDRASDYWRLDLVSDPEDS